MKERQDVITEFGELVNMTAKELKDWLKSDDSRSAGWPGEKDDGESVGHESGRKIVAILESNPGKDPEKYSDEEIQHMRKVVSYCKRHLAQEERSNNEKPIEEVEKTKSFASLKNWGHDCIKKREDKGGRGANKEKKAKDSKTGEKREAEAVDEEDEDKDNDKDNKENDEKKAGQGGKNKADKADKAKNQPKKRKTEPEVVDLKEDDEEKEQDGDDDGDAGGERGASAGPKKGQTVSWNWAGGQPQGKVKDVVPDTATITTKKGNEVSRKGNPEDPAVVLETGKSDAIKLSHELNDVE